MAINPQGLTAQEMGELADKQMRDRVLAESMSNQNTNVYGAPRSDGTTFGAITYTQDPAKAEGQAWLAEQAQRERDDAQAKANKQLADRQQINEAFAGQEGFQAYNVPTANTIGSLYGGTQDSASAMHQNQLNQMMKPIDEAKIRQDAINRVQAEIDAMNRYYAEKTAQEQGEARKVGESNLGQTAAINARRGMLGSDFGDTRRQNVEDATSRVLNSIWQLNNAERLQQQASLMGRASAAGEAEIAKRKAELNQAIKDSMAYQDSLRARAEKRADERIAALIASGQEMTEEDYEKLSREMGIDVQTLKDRYTLALPQSKPNEPIKIGDALVQYNPETGMYEEVYAAKPKPGEALKPFSVAPGSSIFDPTTGEFLGTAPDRPTTNIPEIKNFADGTTRQYNLGTGQWDILASEAPKPGGLTDPQKISTFNSIVNNFARSPLIAARDRTPVLKKSIEDINKNPNDAAAQLNLAYAYVQALDTYQSAVREGELGNLNSIDSKIGALQNSINQMTNGQIVRPEVAKQIAEAAKSIVDTIERAAQEKTKMYGAQAQVAGVGDQWDEFIGLSYGSTATSPTSSPQVTISQIENIAGMSLSPTRRAQVEAILQESPDFSPEEVAEALGFKSVGGDTKPATKTSVGSLSQRFESSGDPGAIGRDSTGGWSYGAYQLAHNNAKTFVDSSPYAREFQGIPFNSPQFRQKWQEVAKRDPQGFKQAQQSFIEQTHIQPQVQKLASQGIDVSRYSPTFQEVLFSTAVQHGPNNNIIAKAIQKVGPNAPEDALIRAIYAERWSGGQRFASSTAQVRKAVYNRFFGKDGELNSALRQLS